MKDLSDKTIRIIGDPRIRIKEDPVRMIRAIRHAARAGFTIEKNAHDAIVELQELITTQPPMRVYEEVKKDLSSGSSLDTLKLLSETGLITHLLPEIAMSNAELLEENSYFSTVLKNIDTYCQNNKTEFIATPILAIIALFLTSYSKSFESLVSHNSDRDEVSDPLKSCFIKLSVPRRERERVDDLLALWIRLNQTPLPRIEKMNLERRRSIGDLALLLAWLEDDNHDGKLIPLVDRAVKERIKD